MKVSGTISLAVIASASALIGSTTAVTGAETTTTLYVGRDFEVRDNEQPVKYVFNGETRVARVTGSLDSNLRVQRLRLFSGWNLCSLAVTATNFVGQANAQPGTISFVFAWDKPTLSWAAVAPGQTLPAAAILWLHCASNADLTIIGTYADPTNSVIDPSGDFLPGAGLEAWDFRAALSKVPSAAAFTYDAAAARWLSRPSPPLEYQSNVPAFVTPGSAVFIQAEAAGELEVPESALRICYYHQDHLGSSSAVTDNEGAIVEETSFYPFGTPRDEFQPREIHESYKFTQKERDRESGMHYFEARYLAASLSRFVAPDINSADPHTLSTEDFVSFLSNPQEINLYGYARNNPLRFVDPTGREAKAAIQKPKTLVVYTPDMFEDAKKRMGFKNEASYKAALKATYRQEAGAKAQITVQSISSVKELETFMTKSSYETVIVNSHAYLNKRALIIGNEDLTPDDLERIVGAGKHAPKKFFFYGCNSAKTGFAGDVAARLPNSEVTGSSSEIRQTSTLEKNQLTIQEDRRFNQTFKKGGTVVDDARKVDINSTSGISRDEFR